MAVDRSVRVGVVGQGGRGQRLADALEAAGHVVVIFDVDRQFIDHNAGSIDARQSLGAVVSASDVVVTAIARDDSLCTVIDAIASVAASGPSATALLDLSPVLPATLREIDMRLQSTPLAVFGATLLLSPQHATWSMFIDGDGTLPADLSRISRALAARVVRCGVLGSSKVLAIVDRLLVGVNTVAAAEAVELAKRAGLAAAVIVPLVLKGSGASDALFRAYADKDAAQTGCRTSTIDDMRAILGRALQLAQAHDHPLLFAALSQNAYRAASGRGLGDEDFTVGIPWAQHARDDALMSQQVAG